MEKLVYWFPYDCHATYQISFLRVYVSLQAKGPHCVKCVRIWSFSTPYFPAFGLNMERYFLFLRI